MLQAEGLPVESITLDVTDAASILAAAARVRERHGRLDILANNAGIFLDDPDKAPSEQSLAAWRDTFETNLFGLVAVTQAFLTLLRESAAGRIVNVSSSLASLVLNNDAGYEFYDFKMPAYNVSKSAVNAWTVQLAWELKGSGVKVNTIHPGYVKTDMTMAHGEQGGDLEVSDGARTSVRLALIDDDGPSGGFFHRDEVLPW